MDKTDTPNLKGLEGTPLGEYAKREKEVEDQKDTDDKKTETGSDQMRQTEKGLRFSGLYKSDDQFGSLGYRK